MWETIEIIRIYFLVRHKTVKYYPFWSGFDIRNSLSESITLCCPKSPLKYIPCKAVQVLKEECSYDVNKFKSSNHKSFSFINKNNNKTQGNEKPFLATVFKMSYLHSSLELTHYTVLVLRDVDQLLTHCSR